MDNQNQSHEIEFSTVGSILRDGKVYSRISKIISPESFHNTICRDIFNAAQKVAAQGLTVDQITIGDQLQREGVLDSILYDVHAGRAALSKLRDIGNPKSAESYAHNVKDYHGKRQAYEIGKDVAVWSKNGRHAVDIIADGIKRLEQLGATFSSAATRTVDAKTAASLTYDEAVQASKGDVKYTITGLTDLDAWFRIRRKSLTIIASRPGKGKSALLSTIALNNARDKKARGIAGCVLILSMEMSVEECTARILSQMSDIPTTHILDGEMDEGEWIKFNDAIAEFETLNIKINDLPAMSIGNITAEAEKHFKDGEDNLLIVDYLQLATSGQNKQNRVEEVGAITRGLKVYAGASGNPVLAAAQLSRAVEQRADQRPALSDLRESGNIEADANNILFIFDDTEITAGANTKNVIVAKQRNGATSYSEGKGDIVLKWNAPITRFENLYTKIESFKNERIK